MPLSAGKFTFVFSDIEGSTRLARRTGARFGELLDRHRAILRRACEEGVEFGSAGDACVFAFRAAGTGVTAAGNAQRLMETWKWPAQGRVRVRIGVHTGEAEVLGESYVGVELHRAARICHAGHGGQVLVSDATVAELGSSAPGFTFRSLGEHMLKDFERPQQLYQLTGVGLADRFDPPRTNLAEPEPLPREASRLIGRRDDLVRVAQLIERTRLVTLTGTGGSGKTRLALRAAWNAKPVWPGPVAFVPMMQLDRVDQVPAVAGRALGRADTITTWEQIIDLFSQRAGLIVFDNAEHLEGVSERMAALRDLTPALTLIITSRSPLQLDGEQVFPVDPLTTADAVELLVDRVSLHLNGYDPNEAEREDLMVIAERLGGLPLALELAAARLRGMSAGALRERLDRQLDLLSGGRIDVPERQRTMRAAIAWSFDLLRASDQAMLSELSLFAAPATLDAIAAVTGGGEAEAIDGLTRLIDASLVRLRAADGRYWLLEPVRQFAAERLAAEFDQATAARARFCDWYYETATSFFDQDADAFQEYDNAVLFFSGEVENTVRALAYLTDAGEWDRAVRLVFDALAVIDMFGASDITSEWVAEARANGRFVSQRSAAMVAILAAEMGPYPGALATHLEAVAACRSADEPWLLRIALRDLAFVALDQAELDVAEGAIRDYAETELVTPHHRMLREILRGRLAMLCKRPAEGAAHLRAAEQIARRSDEQFLVAKCLRETAKGYLCGGEADAALLSAQEGIAASDRGRLPMVDLQCRLVVARAMMSFDPPPRERIARELVAAGQLVGGIRDQYVDFASALILHLTAGVLALEGLDGRAAYLAGAAQNTLASWPTEPDVAGLRAAQRPIDIARERIGSEEWQRCARMGAAASRSEALGTASDWLTETMSDPVESLNP